MRFNKARFGGWAPVWFNMDNNMVLPRGILGHITLPIAEVVEKFRIVVFSILWPDEEPVFMFTVSDECKEINIPYEDL